MPLIIPVTSGFDLHEEDEWYAGTIVDIEEDEGQFGPNLKWIITLDDDDDGRDVWAFCSQKISPRSTLYAWLTGLGVDLDSTAIDMNDLIGKRCQVMFEQYDRDGQTKEKVVKIKAAKTSKPAAKAAPAVDPDEDDLGF